METAIARLWQRMQSMFAMGRITASSDDGPTQRHQVALGPDDTRDGLRLLSGYGFTAVPQPGAEALVVFLGGNRTDGIIIATGDRRYRLRSLAPGEVAMHTDEGDSIVMKRGGTIEVNASTKVQVNSPLVETTGDVIADGISLRNHVHTGVSPGSGTSGPPAT